MSQPQKTIIFDDIYKASKANHNNANKNLLTKAWNTATEKYSNQPHRDNGEDYIMHASRVAFTLASLGFDSEVVSAALLHGIFKYSQADFNELLTIFNSNVVTIVDNYTQFNEYINDKAAAADNDTVAIDETGSLYSLDFESSVGIAALLIKAADRIDNLEYYISTFSKEEQLRKAQTTEDDLIKLVEMAGAYQLVDKLENLCFKIKNTARYLEIESLYNALYDKYQHSVDATLGMIEKIFLTCEKEIATYTKRKSSISSIDRKINSIASNIKEDLPKIICKRNIPMQDITVVFKNDYCDRFPGDTHKGASAFLDFYSNHFGETGITIVDFGVTSHKDSMYYILKDKTNNLYRIFAKSETEYTCYRQGTIIGQSVKSANNGIVDRKERIKIFREDYSAMYIETGSTALDAAFAIHTDLGLHFSSATINTLPNMPPNYVLKEGDHVVIVTDNRIEPKFKWFKYVESNYGKNCLIRYFQTKYGQST